MNSSDLTVIGIFLAAQTGALIFFAGIVAATLRGHENRITSIEAMLREYMLGMAQTQEKREADYEHRRENRG
jgi:hypothetical protein